MTKIRLAKDYTQHNKELNTLEIIAVGEQNGKAIKASKSVELKEFSQ